MSDRRIRELNKLVDRKQIVVQEHCGKFRVYHKIQNRQVTEWMAYAPIRNYLEKGTFINR